MPTVLGKRARSNSNSTIASNCSSATSSSYSSPNKRQRTKSTEDDNSDANKENIPPFIEPEGSPTNRRSSRIAQPVPTSAISQSISTFFSHFNTDIIIYRFLLIFSLAPFLRRQLTRAESTPVVELGNLQLATPPVTPSNSGNNTKANPFTISFYSQARALLRTSSSSTSAVTFNWRESERATIADFFAGKCDKSSLYISGTPGTGKTALVNDILKGMADDVRSEYVNCVGMGAEVIGELARQTRGDCKEEGKTM